MRIGIMGGTLDPTHRGHMTIARAAMEQLGLDGVMLLPAGDPPHKENLAPKQDRLNMARLAAQEVEGVFACALETRRAGTTYTVDTLHELQEMNPATKWYYLIGVDTLRVLDTWKRFDEVARRTEFVVFGRGNEDVREEQARRFAERYGAKIRVLPVNGPEISSTEIRCRANRGEDISAMVPTGVAAYIREKGLYLCGMPREALLAELEQTLAPGRFRHTMGVMETAVRLAERFGVDPRRAELAALLHDCAKYMPTDQMRALVLEGCPDADREEVENERVLHAPAGMVWARKHFGVNDPEILSAIRKHTLGDGQMHALDALIYTADFIEPNRKIFAGLEEARVLAEEDIFAAARRCAQLTNAFVISGGGKPHPKTQRMLENGNGK